MFDRLIKLRGAIRVLSTIAVALFLVSGNSFQVYCKPQINQTNSPQINQTNSPQINQTNSPQINQTNSSQINQTNSPQINQTNSPQNSQNLPDGLILAEEKRIIAIDRNGGNLIQLATSTEPSSPIFDCKRKTVYWIDEFSKIQSLKLFEPQSNISLLFDDDGSVLRSLALDSINDKLYIGNAAFHTIEVIDLKTGIRGIIRSEKLSAINSIAIDSNEGYLFVLGEKELIRMDLDGSNIRTILEALPEEKITRVATGTIWGGYDMVKEDRFLSINSIALNTLEKRLYWVKDANGTISSSTYDGKDKKYRARYKLSPADKAKRPFGSPLAFLSDAPYWIDYGQGAIKRINFANGTDSTTIYKGMAKKVSSVASINCSSNEGQRTNPCEEDNGGCQHLCILSRSSKTNYRCFCKVDYELANDGKSCILPTKFIAFTQRYSITTPNNRSTYGTYLRGINWREDTKQFIDVLDPSKRYAGELTLLEVDTENRTIFYQSGTNNDDYEKNILHGINLNDEKNFTLRPDFRATNVHDFTYDWVTKNLYYFSLYYGFDMTLNVLNTKNPTYSKILANKLKSGSGVAVHPNRGYVYFVQTKPTTWYPPTSKVQRINTDGSNLTILFEQRERISYIAIDFSEDKLYWNEMPLRQDDQENKLYYSNLDGEKITKIEVRLYQPYMMAIQGDWIYVINNNRQSLDRVPKKGGKSEQLIKSGVFGLRIFDSSIQVTRSDHPCNDKNNNCDKFCFAVPNTEKAESLKRICGCAYGEKLAENGRSCIDNSKEEPPLEPCPPDYLRCIRPLNYQQPQTKYSDSILLYSVGNKTFASSDLKTFSIKKKNP